MHYSWLKVKNVFPKWWIIHMFIQWVGRTHYLCSWKTHHVHLMNSVDVSRFGTWMTGWHKISWTPIWFLMKVDFYLTWNLTGHTDNACDVWQNRANCKEMILYWVTDDSEEKEMKWMEASTREKLSYWHCKWMEVQPLLNMWCSLNSCWGLWKTTAA